jgi:hypothetical protein
MPFSQGNNQSIVSKSAVVFKIQSLLPQIQVAHQPEFRRHPDIGTIPNLLSSTQTSRWQEKWDLRL